MFKHTLSHTHTLVEWMEIEYVTLKTIDKIVTKSRPTLTEFQQLMNSTHNIHLTFQWIFSLNSTK